MPKHAERREVGFTAKQMFALVADVETYPEFLPWCTSLKVNAQTWEGPEEILMTEMVLSFHIYRERVGSRVRLRPERSRIEVSYFSGPFRHMDAVWEFVDLGGRCLVRFDVDYEFSNLVLRKLVGALFDHAVQRIISAYEHRARQVYGTGKIAGR